MTILSGDGKHGSPGRAGLTTMTFNGKTVAGWLPRENLATLEMLLNRFDVKSVIEVGSFVGLSACWFAERVDRVFCVDRFDRNISEFAAREVMGETTTDHLELFKRNTAAFPNISYIQSDSVAAAVLPITADLVYIDAGHEYEDVKADVEAWLPHAEKVICGDDNTHTWPGVMRYAREIGADVTERVWWLSLS